MIRFSVLLILSFCFSNCSVAQFFSLPNGAGLVNDVSENGVAAGSFGNSAGQYFIWDIENGVNENIGGVPAGNGVGGQAKISSDGRFVGGVIFNSGSGFHEMSRYDVMAGNWTPLGGLGSSSGSETSSGWNISGDGQSVVGLAWVNAGQTHAAHWRNGVVNDLGTSAAGQSSRANACNDDGSVIAGWQDGNGRQGAVWVNGDQELIFQNGSTAALEASEISSDGKYVVGLGIGPFNGVGNAYRYDVDSNTYLELPNLPSIGERNMAAASITDDGKTIVGGTWGFGVPASFGTGLVWEEGIGTMPVADYLIGKGVKGIPSGYNFNFASSISSDGRWIIGWGGFGFAASQSWAVRIPVAVVIGDVNMDGNIDILDVAPFVNLLQNGEFQVEADINGDGEVDLLDVSPFVALIAGN